MRATDLSVGIVEEADEQGAIRTFLELINLSQKALPSDWRLYSSLGLAPAPEDTRVRRRLIEGRYGFLEPGRDWPGMAPGQTLSIRIENWLLSGMKLLARQGFHLTRMTSAGEQLLGAPVLPAPRLAPLTQVRNTRMAQLSPGCVAAPPARPAVARGGEHQIIPAVKECALSGRLSFRGFSVEGGGFDNEAGHLRAWLSEAGLHHGNAGRIRLVRAPSLPAAGYSLAGSDAGVEILGGDAAGIFHGIQTLRQLVTKEQPGCSLPAHRITDAPDFGYRGFFLDLARHFQPIGQIRKTIKAMAAYKMNRLQLGIANDEGWRLEIPSLPALTGIGSRRSFYADDGQGNPRALYPAWGDDHREVAGYITADEFVELLGFAQRHHVAIIPELNLPGHANALLRSLARHPDFRLSDPADRSTYTSAQGYTGNVVNVGMADTWVVAEAILRDIKAMYDRAGVAFERVHLGGDEVPSGAWLHSPACHRLDIWDGGWNPDDPEDAAAATEALMACHHGKITALAERVAPGVRAGFWHEMSPYGAAGDSGNYYNAWVTEAGDRELVHGILRRGQKLVICNASFLYLDMPYCLDPDEPGLPWASYVDTESIYRFDPLDCWRIPAAKRHLVEGIQAQLWTETVFTPALMDYYVFPRLLAVAERAWNRTPAPRRWPAFATALAGRELGYLASLGIRYRPFR